MSPARVAPRPKCYRFTTRRMWKRPCRASSRTTTSRSSNRGQASTFPSTRRGTSWDRRRSFSAGRRTDLREASFLGRPGRAILKDPEPLPAADYLIIEGTYGGKTHPDEDSLLSALERVVRETAERGGRIVIPAFAVGRTQEVVHALDILMSAGRIPEVPIFIDSPLAADVQEIVQRHPELYDAETAGALRSGGDPLGMRRVKLVRAAEESKALNERQGTFVTISASGMCEAGRILHHLRHTVEDPRHTVVIVGYQAEGTLGKRLVERREEVRILGDFFNVRARIEVLNGFSAHADHPALVAQARSCGAASGTAIVHADLERAEALRAGLSIPSNVRIPVEGETWDLR